jgi:hypothetical protein
VKEQSHKRPIFTEGGEFLEELSEYQLLYAPVSLDLVDG